MKKRLSSTEVFKLTFESGEFDMVVRDLKTGTCEICEIKRSQEAVDDQFRHFLDKGKCAQAERLFGRIASRKVYYRGPDFVHPSGIVYRNVEDYLKSFGRRPAESGVEELHRNKN